jgi:hypothetical protein
MSSRPVCPQGSICSLPYTANVGTNQTLLYFFTSTKVTQDSQGKVNGGTTTLYYSPRPGQYIPSASTSDGGKTWNYLKKEDGSFILGDDARKSLQQGALKTNTNTFVKDALVKRSVPEEQAKTLQLNQNTASSNATTGGDQQGGNTASEGESAPSLKLEDLVIAGGDIRSPKDYSNLKYPLKMDANQDFINFTMVEYVPKKIDTNFISNAQNFGGNQIFGERKKPDGTDAVRGGTVTLPIQPSITDSNAVQWQDSEMNAITAAAGAAALGLISGPTETEKPETTQNSKGNADAVKQLLGYTFAEKAAKGEGGGLFTRATGAIVNPNLELLFQGPTLRSFNFSFTMSAREPAEAIQIKKIIRFFKQGMSVKRAESALFLKSPHIFEIKYVYRGGGKTEIHPWLNTFKLCALTNCTVNYTPAGNYSTFDDGAMTQYDLSLTFTELEPIYDDDYPKDKDATIGY